MPGNVSLPMAISADKPLLVKAVGMLRNAWEVYRFIGGRLLGHHFSALFASFSRHCSSLLHTVIWNTIRFDYTLRCRFRTSVTVADLNTLGGYLSVKFR
jgi:hypothetical protein